MSKWLAYLGPEDYTEEQLISRLEQEPIQPIVSFDVETVSSADQTLIGLGIGLNKREAVYWRIMPHQSPYLNLAWKILSRAGTVVAHNAIFDLTSLLEFILTWGGEVVGGASSDIWHTEISGRPKVPPLVSSLATRIQDTSLALQVQGIPVLNLQGASHYYANTEIQSIEDIKPKGKAMLDLPWEDVANKCLHDCVATLQVWDQIRGPEWGANSGLTWTHNWNLDGIGCMIEDTEHHVSVGMQECYEVDRRLIPLLLRMTARGIALRSDRVEEWYSKLSQERQTYGDIVRRAAMTSMGQEVNPGSNQQVGLLLSYRGNHLPFTKTRKQLKVDEETLESLTDPVVVPILEYRGRDKLMGTYYGPCRGRSRVYTHFKQDLATSRLASSNINLMNWPEEARDVLKPDNGVWSWTDADQLESRILANVAQEPTLLAAYERGEDEHWTTQQRLWPGTRREDSKIRLKSKTFNHAMHYLAEDITLAKHTKLPVSEAAAYKEVWLNLYPEIAEWQQETIDDGWEHGWVENLFGRRCRLPALVAPEGYHTPPSHIEKCSVNYPIQSAAADLIKRAMLHPQVEPMDQALQVHDELLVDGVVEFPRDLENIAPFCTPFKTKHSPIWV